MPSGAASPPSMYRRRLPVDEASSGDHRSGDSVVILSVFVVSLSLLSHSKSTMALEPDFEYREDSVLAQYLRCVLCLAVPAEPMPVVHNLASSKCATVMCRRCYLGPPAWWPIASSPTCPACLQPCAAPSATDRVDRIAEAIIRDLLGVRCLHCPWTGKAVECATMHAKSCVRRALVLLKRAHPEPRVCTGCTPPCGQRSTEDSQPSPDIFPIGPFSQLNCSLAVTPTCVAGTKWPRRSCCPRATRKLSSTYKIGFKGWRTATSSTTPTGLSCE
jgi:hypothetical protein